MSRNCCPDDQPSTVHSSDRIREYWFGSSDAPFDYHEHYKTKWFPIATKLKQIADTTIQTQFGALLHQAEKGELHETWTKQTPSFVALIVLLDQFPRHIYRQQQEKIKTTDPLALALAERFVEEDRHLQVNGAEFVFAMMPFRHSANVQRLHSVIEHVEAKQASAQHHLTLLNKFHTTTLQKLQVLQGEEKNPDDDILERHYFETDEKDLPKHCLYKAMYTFLRQMNASSYKHLGVSLSGGVDSMVVAKLLVNLSSSFSNYKVVAIHIDYGNRGESGLEADYVENWCKKLGIIFYKRHIHEVTRGITDREKYEIITREIRYSTYIEVMNQYGIPGMCFGHHRGDLQENVISNLMKGLSLLQLNGMSETSIVNDVMIWRPFLSYEKDDIFDFAHKYGVPYFKDTTPNWSTRGKLRNKLVPLLSEIYGTGFLQNLSNLGQESMQCGELMKSRIFNEVFELTHVSSVACWLPYGKYTEESIFFWKEILRHICHQKLGTNMIRDKAIREFMQKISPINAFGKANKFKEGWIPLKKQNRTYLTSDHRLIIFRSSFFPIRSNYFKNHDVIVIGESYHFGPWSVITKWIENVKYTTEDVYCKSLSMWSIVESGKLSYLLEDAPAYQINTENRLQMFRAIDKKLTDFMPIVATKIEYDIKPEKTKYASITLLFQE